ncbi:MAG: HNH endonuclease [Methanosarcinales archaeon]
MRGKKHKEETKRKISEKEGRGERISKALKGRKKSEEHKRKLRKSAKERFKDKRERKKMSFRSSISQILKKINDPFGWFLWKYNIEKGMQKYRGDNNPSKRPEVRKKISKNNSMKNSIYRKKSRLGLIKALKGVDRSGDKNSNWRGGTSKEPYPFLFNEILKNKVKERDDFTCRLCGSKKHLAIHHINYDKDDINIDNLVTLCFTCNSRMNGKREFWKNFWRNQYER